MHKNILKYFKKPESKKYDKKQMKEGVNVEQEHTNNPEIAKLISSHHLDEDKSYYKKLKIMEKIKLSDMKKLKKAEDGLVDLTNHKSQEDDSERWSDDDVVRAFTNKYPSEHVIDSAAPNMTKEAAHRIIDSKNHSAIARLFGRVNSYQPDTLDNSHASKLIDDPEMYDQVNEKHNDLGRSVPVEHLDYDPFVHRRINDLLTDQQRDEVLKTKEPGDFYRQIASNHPNIHPDVAEGILSGRIGNGQAASMMMADSSMSRHPEKHRLAEAALDSPYTNVKEKANDTFDLTDQQKMKFLDDGENYGQGGRNKRLDNLFRKPETLGPDILRHIYEKLHDDHTGYGEDYTKEALNHIAAPQDIVEHALKHSNPDIREVAEKKVNHPSIDFTMNTGRLRQLRHELDQSPTKELSKKDMIAKGFDPDALKIKHLLGPKGNLHHDALDRHIETQPKLTFNMEDEKTYGFDKDKREQEERDQYMEDFDPDEHVSKEHYFDEDKALEDHTNSFDPEAYGVHQHEYIHTPEEAEEMAKKGHYESVDEMMEDKGYEKNDEGKLYRKTDYEEAYDNAQQEHRDNFDPNDFMDDDVYLKPSYHDAVDEAGQEHEDNFMPSDYESEEEGERDTEQRHSSEPSKVFELKLHPKHVETLKNNGLLKDFIETHDESLMSGHPATKNTGLGWIRYTQEHPRSGIHIDEVQSDFVAKLNKKIKNAKRDNEPENVKKYQDIQKSIFGEHDPLQVIHEAFLQHKRNEGSVGQDVHIWQARPKAEISGQKTDPTVVHFDNNTKKFSSDNSSMDSIFRKHGIDPDNEKAHELFKQKIDKTGGGGFTYPNGNKVYDIPATLPVKFTEAYDKQPKKMGYHESSYGALDTQHGNQEGEATWAHKLVKKEILCR
jgi:hypothetical protein